MDIFFDENMAVADRTLITYNVQSEKVVVPAYTGEGQKIVRIGRYAFSDSDIVKEITIEPGVEIVKYCAFSNLPNLEKITIPPSVVQSYDGVFKGDGKLKLIKMGMRLKDDEYKELYSNIRYDVNGEAYVMANTFSRLTGTLENMMIDEGYSNWNEQEIRGGIERLFLVGEAEDVISGVIMFSDSNITDEYESVKDIIIGKKTTPYSIEADDMNDYWLRAKQIIEVSKAAVIHFNPNENKMDRDKIIVNFSIELAHAFWQSVEKLQYKGVQYYLYSRNYLYKKNEEEYIKELWDIFDEDGNPLDDMTVKEEIMKKYYLLSMI
ncbi:MAG: leucine-rich repeat domain-containing protein [Lachnospiraceae bacterium]|nr:leucine-rich repeat domain-containing protein [Lachnospiraceae bacterium]